MVSTRTVADPIRQVRLIGLENLACAAVCAVRTPESSFHLKLPYLIQ